MTATYDLPLAGCVEGITESGTYRLPWGGLVTALIPAPGTGEPLRFDLFDERGILVSQRAESRAGIFTREHIAGNVWRPWRRR